MARSRALGALPARCSPRPVFRRFKCGTHLLCHLSELRAPCLSHNSDLKKRQAEEGSEDATFDHMEACTVTTHYECIKRNKRLLLIYMCVASPAERDAALPLPNMWNILL